MKLSIITVNLNNREGLQRTIDSVICQTFRDFEWIVIDGGSTDGSRELIEQYADHFAYWVSEPDKGIYNAMNKGIKVAKGEYIHFLNSGDRFFNEDTLKNIPLYTNKIDIYYGDVVYNFPEGEWIYRFPETVSPRFLIERSLPHSGGSFIKRNILFHYNLYDETLRIVSDWKLFLQAIIDGASTEHVNQIVSIYNTAGISTINNSLNQTERNSVLANIINPTILSDYRYFFSIEEKYNSIYRNAYTLPQLGSLPLRKLVKATWVCLKNKLNIIHD